MKCTCNAALRVASGKRIEEDGKIYWKQTFTCENPACENYKKKIGERKIELPIDNTGHE